MVKSWSKPAPSLMPTFERTIQIAASPESVWTIIADPAMTTKFYPDVISITSEPPGMSKVGQKNTVVAKVAGRKMQQTIEVTEVVPNKKLVLTQVPGGFMKKYVGTTTLDPNNNGTRLTLRSEYEASAGYLGKALGVLVVNRAIKKNLEISAKNIKEIAELKELPPTKKG